MIPDKNRSLLNNRENIAFAHEKEFIFAELEIFSGIREEHDLVAFFDGELRTGTVVENAGFLDS